MGGGGRHLAKKALETLGAEENFSLGHTGTRVGGDHYLVTPPPPLGETGVKLGGGLQQGQGVHLYSGIHNRLF